MLFCWNVIARFRKLCNFQILVVLISQQKTNCFFIGDIDTLSMKLKKQNESILIRWMAFRKMLHLKKYFWIYCNKKIFFHSDYANLYSFDITEHRYFQVDKFQRNWKYVPKDIVYSMCVCAEGRDVILWAS